MKRLLVILLLSAMLICASCNVYCADFTICDDIAEGDAIESGEIRFVINSWRSSDIYEGWGDRLMLPISWWLDNKGGEFSEGDYIVATNLDAGEHTLMITYRKYEFHSDAWFPTGDIIKRELHFRCRRFPAEYAILIAGVIMIGVIWITKKKCKI